MCALALIGAGAAGYALGASHRGHGLLAWRGGRHGHHHHRSSSSSGRRHRSRRGDGERRGHRDAATAVTSAEARDGGENRCERGVALARRGAGGGAGIRARVKRAKTRCERWRRESSSLVLLIFNAYRVLRFTCRRSLAWVVPARTSLLASFAGLRFALGASSTASRRSAAEPRRRRILRSRARRPRTPVAPRPRVSPDHGCFVDVVDVVFEIRRDVDAAVVLDEFLLTRVVFFAPSPSAAVEGSSSFMTSCISISRGAAASGGEVAGAALSCCAVPSTLGDAVAPAPSSSDDDDDTRVDPSSATLPSLASFLFFFAPLSFFFFSFSLLLLRGRLLLCTEFRSSLDERLGRELGEQALLFVLRELFGDVGAEPTV